MGLISDAEYRDGDIHLVGGSYQWEGRVEIYLFGSWGTIADSDWTEEDAAVTCHTLGHILPGPAIQYHIAIIAITVPPACAFTDRYQ